MRRRLSLLVTLLGGALALAVALLAIPSAASTPPSQSVTVPGAGRTVTVKWTGVIPPGTGPLSDCNVATPGDDHTLKITVPRGLYDTATSESTFKITWKPVSGMEETNDEILTVNGPRGEVGSSDGGSTTEMVSGTNLRTGTYTATACGFANSTPQPYTGQLTIVTRKKGGERSLPSAAARGLGFTASVPADNQRDESEPLVEIDPKGRIYTCGPTGFSNASDYAQVSTDGGDQFHLLGTPPRGQQGLGGGGDCALGTAPDRNASGNYQYAYAGLGPLTGFTTSTSDDNGHTLVNAGPQGNGTNLQSVGADRQWLTFLDKRTVLLNYNGQVPRQIVVQKSTDGGLTYDTGRVAASNPDFPGQMRTLAARFLTPGASGRVAYFGWNSSDNKYSYANLAISDTAGNNWKNCVAAKIPLTRSGGLQAFTTADNDRAGNIYLTYGDKKAFHTYLTTLPVARLRDCNQGHDAQPTKNPGWSKPVQVDRNGIRTTVFPWLVAGGAPGRVAVAFYGTPTEGDPNSMKFKATWDVYVNQSLNALSGGRTFSQVKATTHPMHYDQICLGGLGCATGGDRTLGDFFVLDYSRTTGRLSVVFNRANKRPGDAAGAVSSPIVVTQRSGPSNGGTQLRTSPRRVVRTYSPDPRGDALINYSSLFPFSSVMNTPNPMNEKAMDFVSDRVGPEVDPATGKAVKNGGFTVTLKLADLSDGALGQAMADTGSQSLLWVFRFVNGYRAAAASARYNPSDGFTFGYNGYTIDTTTCGAGGGKCVVYPGDTPLKGKVNQATGTIVISVPRTLLRALSGPRGNNQRPTLAKARAGSRFYDATAFSLGNTVSPVQEVGGVPTQSFLYPADNTPAMDFLLAGRRPALRLGVTPQRVRARERTRFRFRVTTTVNGRAAAVRTATVRFAGRTARSDRGGFATIVASLPRAGTYRARATKAGFRSASTMVRATPARSRPRFTG